MCGIFGLVSYSGPVDAELLATCTDLVGHRGPDGRGTVAIGPVGLGHRRLAIIDRSEAGRQPMRHQDLPLTIVFNGEIYNHVELRAELSRLGHRFRSASDTEVILAAYTAWGEECVQRFNGMWAFALWDERSGHLFCSRDRFGVKPLHWVELPGGFAVGSELRQLLPLLQRRCADVVAVADYLATGLTDHRDVEWARGLRTLPAGCSLRLDVATRTWRISRHYTPRPAPDPVHDAHELAQRLRALLNDAVRLRLRSDVRVGTCLSGGLDSSSVATLAARQLEAGSEAFRAITAISELPENSEEAFARQVVKSAHLEWIPVRPSEDDFQAALFEVIDAQEQPFGGPSIVMQHFVMQAARRNGVVVLLDGQGADECWLGYERHLVAWLRERRRCGVKATWKAWCDARANQSRLTIPRLAAMLTGSLWPTLLGRARIARYPGMRRRLALPLAWREHLSRQDDPVAMQANELGATSLPMLLRFADRSSMHHGVEVRLPFLDYRVVELALSVPLSQKLLDGWPKWPLRQAMRDLLPAEIAWRRGKLGFEAPDRLWIPRIRGLMRETVLGSTLLSEFFDMPSLMDRFDNLDSSLAWRLFNVAAWERRQSITDLA